MIFQFGERVLAEYPEDAQRPVMRPTFMLVGIAVTWAAAPTTSENLDIKLVVASDIDDKIVLVSIDPSAKSLRWWVHIVPDGPVPLPHGVTAEVAYTNTDAEVVKVTYLGYWR